MSMSRHQSKTSGINSGMHLQVLVMDAGRVKEFDTVPTLMSQPDSSFRAMVTEAGLAEQA